MPVSKHLNIVAIDGPAGSGKSSLCVAACERMGWYYLSTGASFRAVAFVAKTIDLDIHGNWTDAQRSALIENCRSGLGWDYLGRQVTFGGKPIGNQLYGEEMGKYASIVAEDYEVRELLKVLQRQWTMRCPGNCVLVEGRDIGSVIFPGAPIKIFITASVPVRAKRRYQELKELGHSVSLSEIEEKIAKRDHYDANRKHAPMIKVPEAFELNTSEMGFEDCLDTLCRYIADRLI